MANAKKIRGDTLSGVFFAFSEFMEASKRYSLKIQNLREFLLLG